MHRLFLKESVVAVLAIVASVIALARGAPPGLTITLACLGIAAVACAVVPACKKQLGKILFAVGRAIEHVPIVSRLMPTARVHFTGAAPPFKVGWIGAHGTPSDGFIGRDRGSTFGRVTSQIGSYFTNMAMAIPVRRPMPA